MLVKGFVVKRHYFFPSRHHISQRDNETLYYTPDTQACTVVNRAGLDIIDAFRDGDTARYVAERVLQKTGLPLSHVEEAVASFLDNMVEKNLLRSEPCASYNEGHAEIDGAGGKDEESLFINDLYLHLSSACNLDCVYCYNVGSRKRSAGAHMKFDTVRRRIEEMLSFGLKSVVLTGGEPTMHPDMISIAMYAKGQGCKVSLLTNGTLIDDAMAYAITQYIDSVIVSFDTWDHDEYARICRGASLAQAISGVRALVKYKPRVLLIRPVITRYNVQALPDLPRFAQEHLGYVHFSPALYLPNNSEDGKWVEHLPGVDEYYTAIAAFHREVEKLGGASGVNDMPIESCGSCGAGGRGVVSVDVSGALYPCQCLHYSSLCFCRDDEALEGVCAGNSGLSLFRDMQDTPFQVCQNCVLQSLCASTCSVLRRAFKGREEIFDQHMCPFFKRDVEHVLWRRAEQEAKGQQRK